MLKALLVHKGGIFENVDITAKVAFSKKKKKHFHFTCIFFVRVSYICDKKENKKREPMLY